MRPRKIVLLHCADEDRRRELTFLLDLKGYHVVSEGYCNLALLIDDPEHVAEGVALQTDTARLCLAMLVMIKPQRRQRCNYPESAMKVADNLPTWVLLDWVRLMAARKRGPKPGPRSVRVSEHEVVSA